MKYDITQHSKEANIARNKKLTSVERSAIARIAAKARWKTRVENDLDKCTLCGRQRYKHSRYSEIECKGSY